MIEQTYNVGLDRITISLEGGNLEIQAYVERFIKNLQSRYGYGIAHNEDMVASDDQEDYVTYDDDDDY